MKHCKPFRVFAYYDKKDYKIVLPLQIMLGKNKQEVYDNIIFDLENKWVSKLKDIVFNITELGDSVFDYFNNVGIKYIVEDLTKQEIPTTVKNDFTNTNPYITNDLSNKPLSSPTFKHCTVPNPDYKNLNIIKSIN